MDNTFEYYQVKQDDLILGYFPVPSYFSSIKEAHLKSAIKVLLIQFISYIMMVGGVVDEVKWKNKETKN